MAFLIQFSEEEDLKCLQLCSKPVFASRVGAIKMEMERHPSLLQAYLGWTGLVEEGRVQEIFMKNIPRGISSSYVFSKLHVLHTNTGKESIFPEL